MHQRYLDTIRRLSQANVSKAQRLNLDKILEVSKHLDYPQRKLRAVHLAGTNGKGSVTLKIAKMCEYAGFKTGMYVSPHLFTFRERIQINSEFISAHALTEYVQSLFTLTQSLKIDLTFFEYLTLAAFQHFLDQKVDVAILETGLGGRLDATNIIEQPLAAVITQINYDHCSSLGHTLAEIATQKAGIIKPSSPVIVGPNAVPFEVFERTAAQRGAPLHRVRHTAQSQLDYELENRLTARVSARVLRETQPEFAKKLLDVHVDAGVAQSQPCRLEEFSRQKSFQLRDDFARPFTIFFDVGHNQSGIERTMMRLRRMHPDKKIYAIVGFSTYKDMTLSLKELAKFASRAYFVQAKHQRAMPLTHLMAQIADLRLDVANVDAIFTPPIENGSIPHTLEHALRECDSDTILVVMGSFYIMREARLYFGYRDECDDDIA